MVGVAYCLVGFCVGEVAIDDGLALFVELLC